MEDKVNVRPVVEKYRGIDDYDTVLEALVDWRIVSIETNLGAREVQIYEECDQWFGCTLDYNQFCKLIKELEEIRDAM